MARKEVAVKKYVVKLGDEEREQLNSMINKGKHPARYLLKARILLKADASDAGEGWSDSQIAAVLVTKHRLRDRGLPRSAGAWVRPRPGIVDRATRARDRSLSCRSAHASFRLRGRPAGVSIKPLGRYELCGTSRNAGQTAVQ